MTKYECDRCGKDVRVPWKASVDFQPKGRDRDHEGEEVHWARRSIKLDLCDDCNKAALEFFKVDIPEEAT